MGRQQIKAVKKSLGATVKAQPRAPKKSNPGAFKPGNKFGFKKRENNGGEIDPRIDPGGRKSHGDALLSKNMLIALNNRAPAEMCRAFNLPETSSWSQCLAAFLLHKAFKEDSWEVAIGLIARLIEPAPGTAINILNGNVNGEGVGGASPKMNLYFVKSDGNGGLSEESKELEARIERGEDISNLAVDAEIVWAAEASAKAEVEAKAKEKSKPKSLTVGFDD